MSIELEKVADMIRRDFKECGGIRFWGKSMVAPHFVHGVKKVEAVGESLFIMLFQEDDQTERRIEVVRPRGASVDKLGSLIIDDATELRLDGATIIKRETDRPPALVL